MTGQKHHTGVDQEVHQVSALAHPRTTVRMVATETATSSPSVRMLRTYAVNPIMILFVAAVVASTGFILVTTRAAGSFASAEVETATLSGSSQIIHDSSASAGEAVLLGNSGLNTAKYDLQ